MGRKTKEEVRQLVQIELEDRDSQIWTPDDVMAAIDRALGTLDQHCPASAKAELSFDGATKELDVSDLMDTYALIEIEGVQYPQVEEGITPVGDESFRNWAEKEDGIIEVRLSECPAPGDYANVYYSTKHTLGETAASNTLRPHMEQLVIDLATAYCLMKKPLYYVNDLLVQNLWKEVDKALAEVGSRITAAENEFADGRRLIGTKTASADAAIAAVSARITQALADDTSGRAKLVANNATAVTAIGEMSAMITQAGTDLTSGRALISDKRASADTEIAKVAARVAQAATDMASVRTYANTVNIGEPLTAYARSGQGEIESAMGYLSLVRAYMAEHEPSGGYARSAAGDLQQAMTKFSQVRGYLAADQMATGYADFARTELQSANTYLGQARAYLAEEAAAVEEWYKYALGQLQLANSAIGNANALMNKVKLQAHLVSISDKYYPMGKEKLAICQPLVQRLAIEYSQRVQSRGNNREWPED